MRNLQFERILQISESMYQYARVGDWEQVKHADQKRQQLLQRAISARSIVSHQLGLQRIVQLNQKILELARQQPLSQTPQSSNRDQQSAESARAIWRALINNADKLSPRSDYQT